MDDTWKETIIKTHGLVQRIDERTENTDNKLHDVCDKIDDHEKRIITLETKETVEEVKENWLRQHPLQAGVGAGSITALIGAIVAVITKILEVW